MGKKHPRHILAAVLLVAVLAGACAAPAAGDVPAPLPGQQTDGSGTPGDAPATERPGGVKEQSPPEENGDPRDVPPESSGPEGEEGHPSGTESGTGQSSAQKPRPDAYRTDPVPEGKPKPVEPQNTEVTDTACSCVLSISCAAILDNMDSLDPEKTELVPADGWILQPLTVTFYENESVFDVLLRVCMENSIHMEYTDTPIYNSAYIEGIGNLYEFDCGSLSGWMYSVNGWFPNYGCSRYQLQDGDRVEWVYTCDLGKDVGDNAMADQAGAE